MSAGASWQVLRTSSQQSGGRLEDASAPDHAREPEWPPSGPTPPRPAGLEQRAKERLQIGRELERALENEQLSVVLQPIVDLASGRIIASEAMLQRQSAPGSPMSPNAFLALVDDGHANLGPVGRWVLTNACSEVATVIRSLSRDADLGVSVNVSGAQLASPGLIENVTTALRVSGLRGEDLCLEITQTDLLGELPAALHNLDGLRAMGVRSSLDDCWTGYSSILFVQHFRVDFVKIDPAFVKNVCQAGAQREMVRSVIAIAHSLNARVIADGIRSSDQAEALAALHCDAAQGPYFAPPLAVSDFLNLCRREQLLWETSGSG